MTLKKRYIILFVSLNLLIIATTHPQVILEISAEWWSNGPYSHGLLGFVLCAFCFWQKRHEMPKYQPHYLGILGVVLSTGILLLADLSHLGQLQVLSFLLIFMALLCSVYGYPVLRILFIPLTILALTLPIWNILQIPLRELSTSISFFFIKLYGISVWRENYHILTPAGTFLVEQACSGLGFILASAIYALFIVHIKHISLRKGLYLFGFAIAIALLANWIRIISIIIIGSQTQMQHFVVQDHLTFGWLVFAVCFLITIYVASYCFDFPDKVIKPTTKIDTVAFKISCHYLLSISILLIFMSVLPHLIQARFDKDYRFKLPTFEHYKILGSQYKQSPNWAPNYIGASSTEFMFLMQNETLIQIYVANYRQQTQGKELIFIGNRLFTHKNWSIWKTEKLAISGTLKNVNLLTLRKNKNRIRFIAFFYVINGHFMSSKNNVKIATILAALKGQPGSSLIAISVDSPLKDNAKAKKILTDLISEILTPTK
ncbi:transmembrane protein EpsH [Psychromonas sp. CNPT3]|uniref:exosortase C-terminal domain/associated protein EpsI n=1 Tax=Psychromonas sp. CNPT3 TaxID=314282 RepID=UPI0002C096B7|nr:EpsI domain-containing exosortase [Psychromonas sp. CNPT3]AGH80213.1 transmembrane protein EpsH [Psychromonas sp. CNPT3]